MFRVQSSSLRIGVSRLRVEPEGGGVGAQLRNDLVAALALGLEARDVVLIQE